MKKRLPDVLSRRPLAFTMLFIAICLLPVMAMRDYSPSNELRYLSIADEAIAEGHVFAFTNHGEAYADKPPLYFWFIMLCKLLFGKHNMLALSLFSFIPMLVIIRRADKLSGLTLPLDRAGLALMIASCFFFVGMGVFLRMDMLMCMFILLALESFLKMYGGDGFNGKESFLMPLWIYLALFTKGPVGLLMPLLSILVFLLVKKDYKGIGRYLGFKTFGIIAGLCLVWFAGVWLDGGKDYLDNLLFHQTMGRAVNAFHHKKPLWYYVETYWMVAAPWCLLLAGCVVAALTNRKGRRSDLEIMCLVGSLVTFAMLSSFSSKLSIYLAPILPLLFILFPVYLSRSGWRGWMTAALAVPEGLMSIVFTAAVVLRLFAPGLLWQWLPDYAFLGSGLVWAALSIAAAGCWTGFAEILRGRRWSGSIFATAASILLAVYCISPLTPLVNDYIGYGNVCALVPEDGAVATVGVRRPENMDVYLGRTIEDFGSDTEAFISSLGDRKVTLITPAAKMDERLETLAETYGATYCGPFCVVTYKPDNHQESFFYGSIGKSILEPPCSETHSFR